MHHGCHVKPSNFGDSFFMIIYGFTKNFTITGPVKPIWCILLKADIVEFSGFHLTAVRYFNRFYILII